MKASKQTRSAVRPLLGVTLVAVALLLCNAAAADTAPIDLGNLGTSISGANGINDRGQVVGLSMTGSWTMDAFLWQQGTMTDLGGLVGAGGSGATGINNRGQIIGGSYLMDGSHAWIWQKGVMSELMPFAGGSACSPEAINEAGAVVGLCWVGTGQTHAFLWRDGTMTDLWTLGCQLTEVDDINASGDIVGGYAAGPALCTRKGLTPLCFLESDCGDATAMNDRRADCRCRR